MVWMFGAIAVCGGPAGSRGPRLKGAITDGSGTSSTELKLELSKSPVWVMVTRVVSENVPVSAAVVISSNRMPSVRAPESATMMSVANNVLINEPKVSNCRVPAVVLPDDGNHIERRRRIGEIRFRELENDGSRVVAVHVNGVEIEDRHGGGAQNGFGNSGCGVDYEFADRATERDHARERVNVAAAVV